MQWRNSLQSFVRLLKRLTHWQMLCLVLVSTLGLYLRLRYLPENMRFFGDQAMDFLAALRIVRGEYFPQIGPLLSLQYFTSPPTYYYFLAFWLLLLRTETAVLYLFVAMNIFTGWLLMKYFSHRSDARTGVIFAVLYTLSSNVTDQARMIWQPHPVWFFLAGALWLLVKAKIQNRPKLLPLSLLCLGIGCSLYFPAILFMPFFGFELFDYFRSRKLPSLRSFLLACGLTGGAVGLFFLPNLAYEMQHGWKITNAFAIGSDLTLTENKIAVTYSIIDWLQRIIPQLRILLEFAFPWYKPFFWSQSLQLLLVGLISVIIGWSIWLAIKQQSTPHTLANSLKGFGWLGVGWLGTLLYTGQPLPHRSIVFLPFILFGLAICFKALYQDKKIYSKVALIIITAAYLYTNIYPENPYYMNSTLYKVPRYRGAQELADTLTAKIAADGKQLETTGFKMITPGDHTDYETQVLWYFLKKKSNYSVRFTHPGNDTQRDSVVHPTTNDLFLACFPQETSTQCVETFLQHNPEFKIIDQFWSNRFMIFEAKRKTAAS
jgi:hypothetical protein